jgi:hypothetical protein
MIIKINKNMKLKLHLYNMHKYKLLIINLKIKIVKIINILKINIIFSCIKSDKMIMYIKILMARKPNLKCTHLLLTFNNQINDKIIFWTFQTFKHCQIS